MIVELKAGQLSFDWIIHIHELPPLISQAASECACHVDARTCYGQRIMTAISGLT